MHLLNSLVKMTKSNRKNLELLSILVFYKIQIEYLFGV
jgi:hypothetical protein